MMEQIERVIFSEEQIAKRVQELGERLAEEYVDKRPLIVGILKGSIIFMADLLKAMQIPLEIDFMTISSYGNKAKSSGEVKIVKDLDRTLEGRHLIIVEDVVDSGYTLSYLTNILKMRNPASIKVCTLLDKIDCRKVEFQVDYVGFVCDDSFVIGYGLDYAEEFRNLKFIGELKESYYKK